MQELVLHYPDDEIGTELSDGILAAGGRNP
jgi:hypothetical protein